MRAAILGATCLACLAGVALPALAANPQQLGVAIPASSLQQPQDLGRRAHTNLRRLVLSRAVTPDTAPEVGVFYETPSSLACIYGLIASAKGCNPQTLTAVAKGGSNVVAIVDAYDDPYARTDLQTYSTQFGLPKITAANFQVVYASGSQPSYNSGWATEEALDVQMVHALAPKAKIVLVEAASNSFTDLLAAEQVAAQMVANGGGGEVSNSWSGAEFSGETGSTYTQPFTGTDTVFLASTGDYEVPGYPAILSSVIAVGGTSVSRNPSTGAYRAEVSWDDAGAGPAQYVSRPSFQDGVASTVGSQRGTPDVAAVGNPDTGVWVQFDGSWYVYGGTSVASPVMAAIINAAGHFAVSTPAELTAIYANLGTADFHDITQGTCGDYQFYFTTKSWDFCSGVGSPANLSGL